MKIKKYIGDKKFYKLAFSIILPVMIHQVILSLSGYVDGLMINSYSTNAYNGVSSANRIIFIVIGISLGLTSGIAIFIAQYFGAKNKKGITGAIQLSLIVTIIGGAIISLIIYYLGPVVVRKFLPGNTQEHIESRKEGIAYIQIIAYGGVIFLANFMISNIYRSTKRPKIALMAGFIGVSSNILLNSILIFGDCGSRPMGVKGAAIATISSKGVELVVFLVVALFFSKDKYIYKIFKGNQISKHLTKSYLAKGLFIVLNEIMWSFGMVLIARLITSGNIKWVRAYGYFQNITDIAYIFFSGIAVGTSVLIGSALGEKDYEKAKNYSNKLKGLAFILSISTSILIIALSPALLLIFTPKGNIYYMSYCLVVITAFFIPFYAYNALTYFILRAGGESFSAFFLDQFTTYFLSVPILVLISNYNKDFRINIIYIFLISKIVDVIKAGLSFKVMKKEKWVNNIITEKKKL